MGKNWNLRPQCYRYYKARSQKLPKRSIEFIPQAREASLPSYIWFSMSNYSSSSYIWFSNVILSFCQSHYKKKKKKKKTLKKEAWSRRPITLRKQLKKTKISLTLTAESIASKLFPLSEFLSTFNNKISRQQFQDCTKSRLSESLS